MLYERCRSIFGCFAYWHILHVHMLFERSFDAMFTLEAVLAQIAFAARILRPHSAPMRRSRSAPAEQRIRGQEQGVDEKLSNTNGCGEASPTLWMQWASIRSRLMAVPLFFLPLFRMEIW